MSNEILEIFNKLNNQQDLTLHELVLFISFLNKNKQEINVLFSYNDQTFPAPFVNLFTGLLNPYFSNVLMNSLSANPLIIVEHENYCIMETLDALGNPFYEVREKDYQDNDSYKWKFVTHSKSQEEAYIQYNYLLNNEGDNNELVDKE